MRIAITAACLLLAGCANVSFKQLDANLSARTNAPSGAIYYLPKPYLLVAQMPVAPAAGGEKKLDLPTSPPKAGSTSQGWPTAVAGGGAAGGKEADDKATSDPPTSGGSDQSFGGQSDGYIIKLIYLPDRTRPMAFSMTAGLGQASIKPNLQNGWMLTGFDASADSKAAEVFASLAQVITAYKGPAKTEGGGDEGGAAAMAADNRPVLGPGLYEFRYNKDGYLVGLCPVTEFTGGRAATPSLRPAECNG